MYARTTIFSNLTVQVKLYLVSIFLYIKIQFAVETYSNMYLLNRSKSINTFNFYVCLFLSLVKLSCNVRLEIVLWNINSTTHKI